MRTLSAKIPRLSPAVRPVIQTKSNARSVLPPKVSPLLTNNFIQQKSNSSFSWMRSNKSVQKKTDSNIIKPGRQPFIQQKIKQPFIQLKPVIQQKIEIGKANDHYEHEADTVALQVVNMPQPVAMLSRSMAQSGHSLQRKSVNIGTAPGNYAVSSNHSIYVSSISQSYAMMSGNPSRAGPETSPLDVESRLNNSSGRGSPLGDDVKNFFEPRFHADFSKVRIHTDADAIGMNNRLGSIAFAHGSDIYFNAGQYNFQSKEGKLLIAHELTHVLQQGGAVRRKIADITPAPVSIQRSVVGEVLDWFADKANIIPGFRMFTIVLGINPINGSRVERSGANIIRAAIEFIPGGGLITQALDNYGIFEKAGAWIENEFAQLGMVGGAFKQALSDFIDSLGWSDLLPWNWGDVWDRAKRIFTTPIDRLISFAKGLLLGFIRIIKEAILRPIAKLAEGTRGYDLLKALLGEDPVTGDPVPQTAETLIGGFMKLIGQEEIWENIKKANAIPRAWAWFKNTMASLVALMRQIPGRFVNAFRSLELMDIVVLPRAFVKVGSVFVGIVGDFLSWGLNAVWGLLQIIFEVVAPSVMPYIAKAQAAFKTIIKDPIRFVGNLVKAAKRGFELFKTNFVTHLTNALIKWITGPLGEAGVYIPKSFTLIEIIKLVLSVLGLTWANIRVKLVKIIPEPVLAVLERTAAIVITLVTQGPVAAWEQIKNELTELKNQLIGQVIEMVTSEVVKAAVTKLVMFLNPAGAFIQAIIAIYKTITFFIEKINQIAAVVGSLIDSISAIANGAVENAAKKVEATMANTLTLIITFLANFAGLGGIPDKIVGIVKRIRQPIDRGLDRIVAWLGEILKKIVAAAKKVLNFFRPKSFVVNNESHRFYADDEGNLMLASSPARLSNALNKFRNGPPTPPAAAIPLINQADTKGTLLRTKVNQLKSTSVAGSQEQQLKAESESLSNEIVVLVTQIMTITNGNFQPAMQKTTVTFTFTSNKKAEFDRQLSLQQNGINAMRIGDWAANRARFMAFGRDTSSDTNATRREAISARFIANPVAACQALIGRGLLNNSDEIRVQSILHNPAITDKASILRPIAQTIMNTYGSRNMAVLHSVDQVAGGNSTTYGDDATIFGESDVNSNIGNQWKTKITILDNAIKNVIPTANMDVILKT